MAVFLTIGTRGSPLALAQAHETQARLAEAHGVDVQDIAIEVIKTTGDSVQNRLLSEIGGKGLFTKEIEEALLEKRIDLAVHSSKDMPTTLPDGLEISTYFEREDRRDAIISSFGHSLAALPKGCVLGSASLRRVALAKMARPDLKIIPLRGNVGTRLNKLDDGVCGATFLAMAGLNRLKIKDERISALKTDEFMPAPGQGAICIEVRQADEKVKQLLEPLNHEPTMVELKTERAFLKSLDGSCRTPLAALSVIKDNHIRLKGLVVRPDGTDPKEQQGEAALEDGEKLGKDIGEFLKGQMSENYWQS